MNTKIIWLLLLFSAVSFSQNKTASEIQRQDKNYFLMPYRIQDKWGLSDTLGNIKIQPKYDDIIAAFILPNKQQSFYYFKDNGKTILVDQDNNRRFAEYDSIDNKNNFVYKAGKVGLYNIFYADSDSPKKHDFRIVLEPVYDAIVIDEPYYIVSQNGKKGLLKIGYDNDVHNLLAVEYKSIVAKDKNWIATKMVNGKQVQEQLDYNTDYDIPGPAADPKNIVITDPEKKAARDKEMIIRNLSRDASKEDLEQIMPFRITPINLYVKFRQKNKTGIASFYYSLDGAKKTLLKQVIVPAEYDSIEEMDMYRYLVGNNGKYGIKATYPEGNLELLYDGIAYYPRFTRYILLKKGSKYAVYDTRNNKTITDFEFDGYTYMPSQDKLYYLLLNKRNKKGLMDAGGNIIPAIYDDIIIKTVPINFDGRRTVDMEFKKFRKDGFCGILGFNSAVPEVPIEFDDVFPADEGFYTTVRNHLNGIYSAPRKVNIPPKYKSIKLFTKIWIQNVLVYFFEAVTTDDKKIIVSQEGREFYTK